MPPVAAFSQKKPCQKQGFFMAVPSGSGLGLQSMVAGEQGFLAFLVLRVNLNAFDRTHHHALRFIKVADTLGT